MSLPGFRPSIFRVAALLVAGIALSASTVFAQTVTLRWDPNSEPDLAGYIVQYGTQSGNPSTSIDVGNVTSRQISGLQAGRTYYFRVRAYNESAQQSPPSSEVSYTVPQSGTRLQPVIGSVSPNSGPTGGGTVITVRGSNFDSGARVNIGNVAATNVQRISSSELRATTPAQSAGTYRVQVVNGGGLSASLYNAFTYSSTSGLQPVIYSVSPASGGTGGGTVITVRGKNFESGARVNLGTRAATNVQRISSGELRATTPAQPAGIYRVQVVNPSGKSASLYDSFTYGSPQPVIGSVSPSSGPTGGGTRITIRGTNFDAGARVNVGNRAATNVQRVSSTEIRATTPAQSAGVYRVQVVNGTGLSASLYSAFRYTSTYSADEPIETTMFSAEPGEEDVTATSDLSRLMMDAQMLSAASAQGTAEAAAAEDTAASGADDADGDGLPTAWEERFGLDPADASGEAGAAGDPDGDGATNADELRAGTHPRGVVRRYLAEGAVTQDVATRLALANPGRVPANVLLSFSSAKGETRRVPVMVPARSRVTVDAARIEGLSGAAFATTLESDQEVALDRLLSVGRARTSGSAVAEPSSRWYLADGSTRAPFALFYLVQNPGATAAELQVRYLLPDGAAPITKTYTVAPQSRLTIPVAAQDAALAATEVAAEVTSTNDVPVVVERSTYVLGEDGQSAAGGDSRAGVTEPAATWAFEAPRGEGTLLLLANPGDEPAAVQVTYALADGQQVVAKHDVPAAGRVTVDVAREDARLAGSPVSIRVESLGGTPVVAERTTWRRARGGFEAVGSARAEGDRARWVFAEGEQGGESLASTSLTIANGCAAAARFTVTLLFEDATEQSVAVDVDAGARRTIDIGRTFKNVEGRRFSVVVEAADETAAENVTVERSMSWGAVSARTGTPRSVDF